MAYVDTPGRAELVLWLAEDPKKRTLTAVAHVLGVTISTIYAWKEGIARPEDRYRGLLRILTGIAEQSWSTEAESAEHSDAVARARAARGTLSVRRVSAQ